ncbi:MAG: UvrD-helicase domain-containing protein, partial [Thermodesulfobacteriota bacterium]|nr:UvrD-helicase domain-containing protein [Thermodesulfobacteriota bacterium]
MSKQTKFIADFHVHSHYSIATSKDLNLENLEKWAQLKGIQVVGTGDVIHPGWYDELKEKLIPDEDGLFRLKDEYRLREASEKSFVSFILSGEISNIYKKDGSQRKVHNLILASSLDTVKNIQVKLKNIGNIYSDGRPILGLDSKDLLEIILEAGDDAVLIPAHIWTPWFSVLGSKSGFCCIEECFEDLTSYIFALETGLSSDPPMNWLCSFLDNYTLISNSDAHSPEKLGREANLFFTELSYKGIIEALKSGDKDKFSGTIEFFPEEGKYHFDGHRKCGISWTPEQTIRHKGICPVCGKKVTVGVLNRVVQLADRKDSHERQNRHSFYSITSLKSLLAEIKGVGQKTKGVQYLYESIIKKGGSEFSILLEYPYDRIEEIGGEIVAEGIRRLRNREVYIKAGFDGEFGAVKVFKPGEIKHFSSQTSLFKDGLHVYPPQKREVRPQTRDELLFERNFPREEKGREEALIQNKIQNLNIQQEEAKNHFLGPCLILAGPGTGKTFTLTMRIINLVLERSVDPSSILAITFTRRAKEEMEKRIHMAFAGEIPPDSISIATFHSFGLSILKRYAGNFGRKYPFSIFGEDETGYILRSFSGVAEKEVEDIQHKISRVKNSGFPPISFEDKKFSQIYEDYEMILKRENAFDLDDLVFYPVRLFLERADVIKSYRSSYKFICIDEYQDINKAQYQLIRILAPDRDANICVIGDPDQAIYAFRGANIEFIRNFQTDYPDAKVYKMKKSYRCSNIILKAASQIIDNEDNLHLTG